MLAKQIMTSKVIAATPGTLVREIASLMAANRISAVPIIDGERLVGIVSEADLLHRYEIGTDRAFGGDPWWIRLFSADRSPEEYVKSHARAARDVMTRSVETVTPDTSLAEIATLLEKRRIKRVPVLDGGRLVGILSRSDLVRAIVSVGAARKTTDLTDDAIRGRLLAELQRQSWWRPDLTHVAVEDGVVTYSGMVQLENERTAARVAAETVPGVRRVVDRRPAYFDSGSML